MNDLNSAVLTQTFTDTERLIVRECQRFAYKHKLDFDELFSEAGEAFLEIFAGFDPARSGFSTWLVCKLRYRLASYARSKLIMQRDATTTIQDNIAFNRSTFVLDEFREQLSEDARFCVQIALETPVDVLLDVLAAGDASGRTIRRAIRQHLSDLGWSQRRITRVFREIHEALK